MKVNLFWPIHFNWRYFSMKKPSIIHSVRCVIYRKALVTICMHIAYKWVLEWKAILGIPCNSAGLCILNDQLTTISVQWKSMYAIFYSYRFVILCMYVCIYIICIHNRSFDNYTIICLWWWSRGKAQIIWKDFFFLNFCLCWNDYIFVCTKSWFLKIIYLFYFSTIFDTHCLIEYVSMYILASVIPNI